MVCVSCQVKAKIHSHISRQLECLRSREVWLFEQVDLIQQLKEEALQQQAQQLYWVSLVVSCCTGIFKQTFSLQVLAQF